MTKTALGVIALLLVTGAAVGGYWYGARNSAVSGAGVAVNVPAGNAKGAPANNAPVVVEAVKVTVMAMPQTITAVGSLRSDESITVRPEVAGRISAILFQEGQRVTQGATLVRLDPSINAA